MVVGSTYICFFFGEKVRRKVSKGSELVKEDRRKCGKTLHNNIRQQVCGREQSPNVLSKVSGTYSVTAIQT